MNTKKFILYAVGIFISYFYFGILQEQVTRSKYSYEVTDEDGKKSIITEKFTFALTLVFTQCIINYFIANIALHFWPQVDDKTPTLYYASVSVTYLLAMVASNMALQWVPYPTQVVGKSAKPIPVMILGVLLGRKSYLFKKYVFVFLIVTGVVLFMLKDKASKAAQENGLGIGELLLVLSLLMDGLTGAIQERIRAEARPSGIQMMKTSNGWSTLYLAAVILLSGEIVKFMDFTRRYPFISYDLVLIGLTSAVGQLFLYSMVSDFGPLVVSVVTTTRKFFTVLGSVILFGNTLTSRQWIGACLVFTGLFLDAFFAKAVPKPKIGN